MSVINRRLYASEVLISELEDMKQKVKQTEKNTGKNYEQSNSQLQDNFRQPNLCVTEVPKGKKREVEGSTEKIIMAKEFSNQTKQLETYRPKKL